MGEPGTITDEAVATLRRRIGVAEPHPVPPRYRRPVIAPPPLVGGDSLIGEDEVTEIEPGSRELMRGDPLRGVHAFYAASAREWWRPLRPGKRVRRRNALVGVFDKASEFA